MATDSKTGMVGTTHQTRHVALATTQSQRTDGGQAHGAGHTSQEAHPRMLLGLR